MQEIKIDGNETGLKIFINGVPDFSLMPTDKIELLVSSIEKIMTEQMKDNKQCSTKSTEIVFK